MASPFDLTRDPARWPAFLGPLPCPEQAVEPTWIDYNGHMNMAYYHVAFDRAMQILPMTSWASAPITSRRPRPPFYRGGARLLSPGAEPGGALHRELAAPGLRQQTASLFRAPPLRRATHRDLRTNGPTRLHGDSANGPFPEEAVARLDYVAKAHAALPSASATGAGILEFPSPEGNGNWRDRNIIGHA